jgi:hypothetical protein
MRLEIFTPLYLCKKNSRPVIQNVATEIHYGGLVEVQMSQAAQAKWISLVAPGLTTHSFNATQRLVAFRSRGRPEYYTAPSRIIRMSRRRGGTLSSWLTPTRRRQSPVGFA